VTGLLAVDYAPLVHLDPGDCGPTAVFRFTNANTNATKAYHFVQPTLWCNQKRGVVCIQRAGTLMVFRATKFFHSSTINEHQPDPACPSLGVVCVQKMRTLKKSEDRSDVLENMVNFCILETYHETQIAKDTEEPVL